MKQNIHDNLVATLLPRTGLSQSEFAKMIDVNYSTVKGYAQNLWATPDKVVYSIFSIIQEMEKSANEIVETFKKIKAEKSGTGCFFIPLITTEEGAKKSGSFSLGYHRVMIAQAVYIASCQNIDVQIGVPPAKSQGFYISKEADQISPTIEEVPTIH